MPAKVILKVTQGAMAGQEFVYDSKEQLIIGRQDDCAIVLPEKTVSRYHCMLEVTPPEVTVRDFGSLNGTFLNGKKIGQRSQEASIEAAQQEYHEEFKLCQGDRLGLSKNCEFTMYAYVPRYCSGCGEELPEDQMLHCATEDGTVICRSCFDQQARIKAQAEAARIAAEKAERKRMRAEQQAAEKAERERRKADGTQLEPILPQEYPEPEQAAPVKQAKCEGCGAIYTPNGSEQTLCPSCRENPAAILDALLKKLMAEMEQEAAPAKGAGPSPVNGYQKIKLLGKGGMGEVWLVQEQRTGKKMALKTMLPKVAADKLAKNLFLREALLGEYLDHKNVVKVYKSGSAHGVFYILMELCEGGSVDDLIKKHGGILPLDMATYIMIQVLNGLDYTHNAQVKVKLGLRKKNAEGVVHRDFKPGNIFLSDHSNRPIAKVADFGLAKAFETAGLSGNTRTGTAAGTPVFMPRQQITNYKYAKPDVDVWAAAASYYYMLTGAPPKDYKGGDIWMAMLNNKAVPIQERNPHLPARLAEVIDRALVEKPYIGISTAAELKNEITAALPDDIKRAVKEVM